ncbi:MAG TPA: hypothetical protein VM470_08425, partial [Acidimicrobiia bacterium]|nr:hypothetical protein [Acidimicrobiia bacterium]
VDLLSDRRGEGKYGIRSLAVLDHATMGHSWPTVSHIPQILYAIRKRQVKRQHGRLEPLIAEARGIPADELASVAKEIFSFPVARDVLRLIRIFPQWVDPEMVPGYRGRRLLVGTRRLLSPVGFWVEIHGGAEARELCQGLADRFGRFLPHRACSPRPMGLGGEMRWFLRQVAPIRWRPGLIASWTPRRSRWLKPDLTVEPEGVEQAARKVVQAMEARLGL